MLSRGCVLNMAPYRGTVSPSTVTWHDASRYHNDGTLTDVTWTRLPSGLWVAGLNGTTSFISVADSGGLNITARPLTIVAWVKPASDASASYAICRNLDSGANTQYGLVWNTAASTSLSLEGSSRATGVNSSVPKSSWTLAGATWLTDGTSQSYANGLATGSAGVAFTSTLTSRATISIGRRVDGAYFKGDMALWRVLPVAWSAADWSRTFTAERRLFGV
jgi:hypothetical protein